jgi:pseudaminic acid biosynthesis-associated methylase
MNEQELAWAGEHGNTYNRRSPGDESANYALFKSIWVKNLPPIAYGAHPVQSILELGAGQGANLRALRKIFPAARRTAVEINRQACEVLAGTHTAERIVSASVLDWEPDERFDIVLTKGLLIHIHPDELHLAYEVIHRAAKRWILLCEYYSPRVEVIPYRGRDDLLWKAPHAQDMLERYSDLSLLDYGFVSKLDTHPQDDLHWWLLERTPPKVRGQAWPLSAVAP